MFVRATVHEGQVPSQPFAEPASNDLSRTLQAPPETLSARLGGPYRGNRLVVLGLLLTVAYVVLGHLGLGFAFYQERSTIIWAPSGLSIAAVWLFGNRVLWAVCLGAFLTNVIASPGLTPVNLSLSLLIALGNTGEAWLGGWLVRRGKLEEGLRGTRDVIVYVATVVTLATLVSALNGVA